MSSPVFSGRAARLFGRVTTHGDLTIQYEGHSEVLPTRVPDLSARGMFINTRRDFAEGSVLKVSFRLTASGYVVDARAEVRYCLPGVGVGVEFVEITDEARAAIEAEVSRWLP